MVTVLLQNFKNFLTNLSLLPSQFSLPIWPMAFNFYDSDSVCNREIEGIGKYCLFCLYLSLPHLKIMNFNNSVISNSITEGWVILCQLG